MGLRHKKYDVAGLQFHPESYATPFGADIIRNWLGCSF
jgi:anthranilate synthase component 2